MRGLRCVNWNKNFLRDPVVCWNSINCWVDVWTKELEVTERLGTLHYELYN